MVEDAGGETATRVIRMNEEGANFCGLGSGVEKRVVALSRIAATMMLNPAGSAEGATAAPATAGDQLAILLNDEVSGVVNELEIDSKAGE
jgi:hypothetical protein